MYFSLFTIIRKVLFRYTFTKLLYTKVIWKKEQFLFGINSDDF